MEVGFGGPTVLPETEYLVLFRTWVVSISDSKSLRRRLIASIVLHHQPQKRVCVGTLDQQAHLPHIYMEFVVLTL
jgi:hypothetical protein